MDSERLRKHEANRFASQGWYNRPPWTQHFIEENSDSEIQHRPLNWTGRENYEQNTFITQEQAPSTASPIKSVRTIHGAPISAKKDQERTSNAVLISPEDYISLSIYNKDSTRFDTEFSSNGYLPTSPSLFKSPTAQGYRRICASSSCNTISQTQKAVPVIKYNKNVQKQAKQHIDLTGQWIVNSDSDARQQQSSQIDTRRDTAQSTGQQQYERCHRNFSVGIDVNAMYEDCCDKRFSENLPQPGAFLTSNPFYGMVKSIGKKGKKHKCRSRKKSKKRHK